MEPREFRIGEEPVRGELLWRAEFAPEEKEAGHSPQWLFEAQGGTLQFAGGRAVIDCCEKRGATLWVRREFPADLVIEYAGTCLPPSTGRRALIFTSSARAIPRKLIP